MKKDLGIRTWNIRTLYKDGALKNLIDVFVKYNIDILAIQEIRWLGIGILGKKKKTAISTTSCQEKAHHFGVDFIMSKRLRNAGIDFEAISMRLCKNRLKGKYYNTTLICAHAQTNEKDDAEKDLLYDLFMKSYDSCPAQDMRLVIVDFNAKIGKERFIRSHAGHNSLHNDTNGNGQRLFEFAVSENMLIASTAFPHKEIHKYTWISPDGLTLNQIDHVLTCR
ncbi:Craniofacial development protein 2 [Araneus ventricosus]|uniref:Craniofacial development protein 2 n=1 Tax=Araneus ventricosus TaxID=182803 RepID=A0A4Y2DVB5_ARAVE|nr:Craniofacial development protein 2 [Araneus ventricosus]